MAPVIHALSAFPEQIKAITCATAQHREMLDQVLPLFQIVPDIDLDIMRPGQTPNQVASRLLAELEPIYRDYHPDWILVQGDTTTVMASALAAHHSRLRIGHVESGLRTGDRWNPFPEEMNRVLVDHLSDLCFAPTESARQNLLHEGIPDEVIRVTGNTVVDALQSVIRQPWQPADEHLLALIESKARLLLVTAHRRESFGQPLRDICYALKAIAERFREDVQIVYPVHPNPQVRGPVYELLSSQSNIALISPVDYVSLVNLMRRSTLILTDSGGIQEEAPSLGIPVLVLRDTTERWEPIEAGVARLVGTDTGRITAETYRILNDPEEHSRMAQGASLYGDGHAADRIVQALLEYQG